MGMSQESIENLSVLCAPMRPSFWNRWPKRLARSAGKIEFGRGPNTSDIMHKPFGALSEADVERLCIEIRKLVNQLRSRVALRHKRGKDGRFDPKGTIRANLRYGACRSNSNSSATSSNPAFVLLMDVSRLDGTGCRVHVAPDVRTQ